MGATLQVQDLLNVNGNWTVSPGTATVNGGTVQTFGDFNLGGGGTLIATPISTFRRRTSTAAALW